MRVRLIALRQNAEAEGGEELIDITEADFARCAWRLLAGLLRQQGRGHFRIIVERLSEDFFSSDRTDAFITIA